MIRKSRYHNEYNLIIDDNVIRYSQDFEKNTWFLKKDGSKGALVIGFEPLHWDQISAMRTAIDNMKINYDNIKIDCKDTG